MMCYFELGMGMIGRCIFQVIKLFNETALV